MPETEADISSHIKRLRKIAAEAGEAAGDDPVANTALLYVFCELAGKGAGRMAGENYTQLEAVLERCASELTKAAMKQHFAGRIGNGGDDQGGAEA